MTHRIKILGILIFLLTFTSFSFAFKFASTWSPPGAQPVDFSGKKVVVLVLGRNLQRCLSAEQQLAGIINTRGAVAIAGHTLVTENDLKDKDKLKSKLEQEGIAGGVVIRAWIRGQKAEGPDQNRSFWSFYGESLETDSGEPPDNVDLYVETRVYSIDQDALIWTGSCSTKSSKIEKFIQELVPAVAEQMQKKGLLKK